MQKWLYLQRKMSTIGIEKQGGGFMTSRFLRSERQEMVSVHLRILPEETWRQI